MEVKDGASQGVVCEEVGENLKPDLERAWKYGSTIHAMELWAAQEWGLDTNHV